VFQGAFEGADFSTLHWALSSSFHEISTVWLLCDLSVRRLVCKPVV